MLKLQSKEKPCLSVICLLEEETTGFCQYIESIFHVIFSLCQPFEMLIVSNGTEGFLRNQLKGIHSTNGRLKAFALDKKASQAVCLKAAVKETSGEIVLVLGSYPQVSTDSIPLLLNALDETTDVVSPWRQNRVDPPLNQLQSKLFNWLVQRATRSDLNDLSCTVRLFRRQVLEETSLYGGMYRFLPILAAQKGFKTKEVKCEHQQERGKTGFYSISEYADRILDILTLYFTNRFSRKPLRFFSTVGLVFLMAGLLMMGCIFAQKVLLWEPLGSRPFFLLATLLMVLGVQASGVGLLGEIIAFTHGRNKKVYTIEKVI